MKSSHGEERRNSPESGYWFSRHAKPVIFVILTLALSGGYLAFSIPVAVFPATNFPRILIAVDNGVMPTDQMMVAITRPIEEGVNSVPGLQEVRSITSRGSAEIDLFFDWNVDMFRTLQYVNAAISRVQPELPPTASVVATRLTFASFPIIGYSLTSATVPQTQLWEMATYEIKPRLNRLDGVSSVLVQGGQQPEFHITPDPAKLLTANVTVTASPGYDATHQPHRFAGTLRAQPPTGAGAGERAGTNSAADRGHGGQEHARGNSSAYRRRGRSRAGSKARVHDRHR